MVDAGASPGTSRAFIDESMRCSRANDGFYVLAAAVLGESECANVRDSLERLLMRSQQRLHWRDESAARRRKIKDALAEIECLHLVTVGAPLHPKRQERGRRKCLEAMLRELDSLKVQQVLLENRTEEQNRLDMEAVRFFRACHTISHHLHVGQGYPKSESLLWVADAVAGMVRAHRAGESDEFDSFIEERVMRFDIPI